MAIIQEITWRALPIETLNIFSAAFNGGGAGQYNFTIVPGNVGQVVMQMNQRYIYLIDTLSFSASIPEGVYLESVDQASTATVPSIGMKYTQTPYFIFPRRFPGVNYKDGLPLSFWLWNPKANEQLRIEMGGILNQVAATVGVATIYAQLSLVVYQEFMTIKQRNMLKGMGKKTGDFYSGFASTDKTGRKHLDLGRAR